MFPLSLFFDVLSLSDQLHSTCHNNRGLSVRCLGLTPAYCDNCGSVEGSSHGMKLWKNERRDKVHSMEPRHEFAKWSHDRVEQ